MDIRKRMTWFLKRAMDTTYITKKDFESAFKDIYGTKIAKGILFKNRVQQIYMFPSKKTFTYKNKEGKVTYRFNRFVISSGKGKTHLLIEADPRIFQFLVKTKTIIEKRYLSRKNASGTIIRERFYIPVNKRFVSKSSSIEITLHPKEMSDIQTQFRTLSIKQRNRVLKHHLEKLLRTRELSEVLRMGFTIQDIMLFLPALQLPISKKQKLIDQIFYLSNKRK